MNPNHQTALCVLDKQGDILRYAPGTLPIYSITKTLIASAILTTEVDLDTSIHTWIDPGLCPHSVTVSQLLNHTSGLSDYGALPAYQDAIDAGNPWSDAEFARHTLQQPLLFEPGTHFAYSNPGYFLLKSILEAVTDRAFTEIMQTLIFEPFEMISARCQGAVRRRPCLVSGGVGLAWPGSVGSGRRCSIHGASAAPIQVEQCTG